MADGPLQIQEQNKTQKMPVRDRPEVQDPEVTAIESVLVEWLSPP